MKIDVEYVPESLTIAEQSLIKFGKSIRQASAGANDGR